MDSLERTVEDSDENLGWIVFRVGLYTLAVDVPITIVVRVQKFSADRFGRTVKDSEKT